MELRPKGFLPVALIEGRIAADLQGNFKAIRDHVEGKYEVRKAREQQLLLAHQEEEEEEERVRLQESMLTNAIKEVTDTSQHNTDRQSDEAVEGRAGMSMAGTSITSPTPVTVEQSVDSTADISVPTTTPHVPSSIHVSMGINTGADAADNATSSGDNSSSSDIEGGTVEAVAADGSSISNVFKRIFGWITPEDSSASPDSSTHTGDKDSNQDVSSSATVVSVLQQENAELRAQVADLQMKLNRSEEVLSKMRDMLLLVDMKVTDDSEKKVL